MSEMQTVKVGVLLLQDNQERKFGEDPQYAVVWVTKAGVEEAIPLVFTEEELEEAMLRGKNNPEDIPELGSETSINEFDQE